MIDLTGSYVRLRYDCMRVDGARFREGQRFRVAREYSAVGDNGWTRCLALANEAGEWVIPCIEKADVDVEQEPKHAK